MSVFPYIAKQVPVLTQLPKVQQTAKQLQNKVQELNYHAQNLRVQWLKPASKVGNLQHGFDKTVYQVQTKLGLNNTFRKEKIRNDVKLASWLLMRQQVNVLTPMKAFVDLDVVKDPLPLLVMEEKFASDMLDIITGKKHDQTWDNSILSFLTTMPGYNVIAAGKKLHVDYDFPNAIQYTIEQIGRAPSIEEWSKGFGPVLVGLEQTQKEMLRHLPLNLFNIGTRLPLANDQFFYWRNQPLKKVHGEEAIYEYPDKKLLELLRKYTEYLPFDYMAGIVPPLVTYGPDGELVLPDEVVPPDKDDK